MVTICLALAQATQSVLPLAVAVIAQGENPSGATGALVEADTAQTQTMHNPLKTPLCIKFSYLRFVIQGRGKMRIGPPLRLDFPSFLVLSKIDSRHLV